MPMQGLFPPSLACRLLSRSTLRPAGASFRLFSASSAALSTASNATMSDAPASTGSGSSLPHTALNHYLRETHERFRALASASTSSSSSDASEAPVRIVMGNEAGDLDSLVCAIAFSYLSAQRAKSASAHAQTTDDSSSAGARWYPLVQTERRDLKLRPENSLALRSCFVDEAHLITLDDFDEVLGSSASKVEVALVDHCKLSSRWAQTLDVTAVIDHHADEGLYASASPRSIVRPTECGSCASLLTHHFRAELQDRATGSTELARLLLSAIAIDTHNMDPAVGKAKALDLEAVQILMPLAGFGARQQQQQQQQVSASGAAPAPAPYESMDAFHLALHKAKEDVSALSTRDLCRRDYKEYSHPGSASSGDDGRRWKVGLTSIPWSLQEWIRRDGESAFLQGCVDFCAERGLHAFGALTAYSDADGFHRQIAFVAPFSSSGDHEAIRNLADLLESNKPEELSLAQNDSYGIKAQNAAGQPFVRIWDQRNLKATRKQVAPAFKEACALVSAPESSP